MAHRGNAGDTAIVLKTASRDFREEFTPADYGFYSIHRRVTLLPALKSQGIVRNAGRGRYKVTPEGIEWAREQFSHMGPVENPMSSDESGMLVGGGAGAILGALLGGPIGAAAGAVGGALIGSQTRVYRSTNPTERGLPREAGAAGSKERAEYRAWLIRRLGMSKEQASGSTTLELHNELQSRN